MPGINRSADLKERLSRIAEILPAGAGAATEERLLVAFRARRRKRIVWRSLVAAVCIALGLGMFLTRHSSQASQKGVSQDRLSLTSEGFIELPYAESGVPMEDAVIVRLRLRASELRRLGVPVGPPAPAGRVADLLVGQDGVARAVRLVE